MSIDKMTVRFFIQYSTRVDINYDTITTALEQKACFIIGKYFEIFAYF